MRRSRRHVWQVAVGLTFAAGVAPNSAPGIEIAAVDADTRAPSPPSELWLREAGEHSVILAWIASTDDVGVAGYRLYERVRLNRFHERWLVRFTAVASMEAEITGLAPGSAHEYALSAFDDAGNESAKSRSLKVTVLRSPLAYRAAGAAARSAVFDEPFYEEIRALGVPPPAFSLVVAPEGMTIDPQGGTIHWTPPPGSESAATVVVRATNRVGEHRLSFRLEVGPAGIDREPPSTVPTPNANRTTERGAMITWLPATDNVGVAGYRVFAQATGRGNSLFRAAEVAAPVTTHELTSLAAATRYRVWVAAYDRAGNTGVISGIRPLLLRTLRREPRPREP